MPSPWNATLEVSGRRATRPPSASGLPSLWLNVMGIVLIIARLSHLIGLSVDKPAAPLRIIGGAGTQLVLIAAAGWLVWSQF